MLKFSLLTLVAAITIFINGCTYNTLYYWGDYQSDVYEYANQDLTIHDLIEKLETTKAKFNTERKAPPGFYAELGTLYLQSGDQNLAILNYKKEQETWPESTTFMSALINNLDNSKKNTNFNANKTSEEQVLEIEAEIKGKVK